MSVDKSSRHYFLSLVIDDLTDTVINTTKDDILTIRIKKVPGTIFFMDNPNDSFTCDLEISGR